MAKNELNDINYKEILILGGTGSLGKALIKKLTEECEPGGIRIYSRDELKQWELSRKYTKNIDFLIGDVRDKDRLKLAMKGAQIIINCAAMKQVPACENNPHEAIKTNVTGAANIIEGAIWNKSVEKIMHISTDKACNPINLYGATKLCAEKIFLSSSKYIGGRDLKVSCCRYGNVLGSRGSVIPLFFKQKEEGLITITDPGMTRFWIKLDQVADFILNNIKSMSGGEIFIPKMPSGKITDLADIIAPGVKQKITGIRFGEKIHETLITEEESRNLTEKKDMFIISKKLNDYFDKFSYTSENNPWKLTKNELKNLIKEFTNHEIV
jgi:UDP-N-acetylglucosamine 4,6-dehydratase